MARSNPLTVGAVAGTLLFTVAFFGFVEMAENEPAEQASRMSQINAEIDAAEDSMQRAAAALCRAELGPGAQVLWTREGDLVCRPAVMTAQAEGGQP